jgi:hypothetical protein
MIGEESTCVMKDTDGSIIELVLGFKRKYKISKLLDYCSNIPVFFIKAKLKFKSVILKMQMIIKKNKLI